MTAYTIVGVVGHIDHGKTTLVKSLTGADTDTHPEEKQRGITIDLGFASLQEQGHEFGFIDAPGHQKYIGNLLAGVSAIDIGLLVVACDQGIQAQTIEHMAILKALGVSQLIAVISRIDLCDADTLEQLVEYLEFFLQEEGFEDVPILPVSTVTEAGLPELKSALRESSRTTPRTSPGAFRMPIDRVFSVPGRGCVVAGTVWNGTVQLEDKLEVAGKGEVRVRELEAHSSKVQESGIGKRTALNLTGISARELSRGDELIATGCFPLVNQLLVEVTLFQEAAEIRCPTLIQLHTGTTACQARISGPKQVSRGEPTVVVMQTQRPIIAQYGQRCLFRRPAPFGSVAGGRILGAIQPPERHTKKLLDLGIELTSSNAMARLAGWVDHAGELHVEQRWFTRELGVSEDQIDSLIQQAIDTGRCLRFTKGVLVSPDLVKRVRKQLLWTLKQAIDENSPWIIQESLIDRLRKLASPLLVEQAIGELIQEKEIIKQDKLVALATDETQLSKAQQRRMQQLLELYSGSRTPPTFESTANDLGISKQAVLSLVRFAIQQGRLTQISPEFAYCSETLSELFRELGALFLAEDVLLVSQIRDQWQMSRKHAVPLLEYCDQIGLTKRNGSERIAGPNLQQQTQTMESSCESE